MFPSLPGLTAYRHVHAINFAALDVRLCLDVDQYELCVFLSPSLPPLELMHLAAGGANEDKYMTEPKKKKKSTLIRPDLHVIRILVVKSH